MCNLTMKRLLIANGKTQNPLSESDKLLLRKIADLQKIARKIYSGELEFFQELTKRETDLVIENLNANNANRYFQEYGASGRMALTKLGEALTKKKNVTPNPKTQSGDIQKNIDTFFKLLDKAKMSDILTAPISIALSLVNSAISKANQILKEALEDL